MALPVSNPPPDRNTGREEPPLIQGLLIRGARQFEDALTQDIAAVLAMTDAVIDLDVWTHDGLDT